MATKIVTKNSSTASAVPTASDLVQGELAVNVADKRLFTEDNGGSIIELGTNPSTIDINAGTIDGTAIGASSASTGAFTTLTATGAFTSRGIDDNADATAITIDSSENVGIGTASPVIPVQLNNYGGLDGNANQLILSNNAYYSGGDKAVKSGFSTRIDLTNQDGSIRFLNTSASSSANAAITFAERLRIDSSGNVGIGTVPSAWASSFTALQVENASLWSTGSDASLTANAYYDGSNYKYIASSGASRQYHNTDGSIVWSQASSGTAGNNITFAERMRIDSSGNVGIGTSSPTNPLHITAAQPTVYLETSGGGATDAAYLQKYSNDVYLYNKESAGKLYLGTNNATKVTLDSSGNVGIGTTSPSSAKMHVETSSGSNCLKVGTATQGVFIKATGTVIDYNASGDAGGEHAFSTGNTERMRIDSSGNLLVGTTSTPNGGHVLKIASGTVSTVETDVTTVINMIVFRNGNGNVGTIQTNGSTTTYNTSSDQRLKENIADADDAGSKIDAIQVRKFDWKADGSHQDYGMIAQELQAVAPEAVSGDADSEEMMGVDYSKLVPMLIKEIQSLRNRVAQLEE